MNDKKTRKKTCRSIDVPQELKEVIIQKYLEGLNSRELVEKFGFTQSTMCRIITNSNVKKRSISATHRKYEIDESFFDEINTEEKAYFIGFLYADGYNDEKHGIVSISLRYDDREILEKLRTIVGSTKPLQYIKYNSKNSKRENQFRVILVSRHMSERLADLGMMQAKTFKIIFPKWLDKKLYSHFIRGYFDGDGHVGISYKDDKKNGRFGIVGTKEFCESIKDILKIECNANLGIRKRFNSKPESYNIVQAECGGNLQVLRILNYIYCDSNIYMERKHEKYLEILSFYEK